MSYLNKYKVGDSFFRTLSEGRMQLSVLQNIIRYRHPAPTSITGIRDYQERHHDSCMYEKGNDAFLFTFPQTEVEPKAARPLIEKQKQVEFPETFVLRINNGRVLGDGTVIGAGNDIISETTTDFHRKQEFHHLLSERRVPQPERFEGRLAVITSPGSNNYFHWTLDSLPRLSLLQDMDDEIDGYYVDNRSRFHLEWLDMLGIPENKIIPASPEHHIEAKELIVPSFAGITGLPSPDGLRFVRSFMTSTKHNRRRIYISRSGSRRRRILNEDKILPLLEQHGFEIIHPGEMTVAKQMETFSSADVIISPHGAELTNLAYCQPGTQIIELFSPYYLNPCFKQLSAICKLEYTALVGKEAERVLRQQIDAHYVWANIRVDTNRLEKELNRIEKRT